MRTEFAPNVAVFCDYENVAIGVRDAHYDQFDIEMVLERILDKGKVVLKKAYADWDRYKSAKRPMHEAAFELIEIPHISYSGKNSADIRMVVDALDLCYTKKHVDVFVIVSGDSDFSPLVSKLRENNKTVIGIGVKNSSSDLLIENCDEFIYYDDLVRARRAATRKKPKHRKRSGRGKPSAPDDEAKAKDGKDEPRATETKQLPKPGNGTGNNGNGARADKRSAAEKLGEKQEALDIVLDVVESLFADRDSNLWGSMVKQVLKRKRPQFSESYYGYRSFNHLLEDARDQALLEVQKDEKSGGYVILGFGPKA